MTIDVNKVLPKYVSKLEKKMMGGVTTESATKAIKDAIQETEQTVRVSANEAVNKLETAHFKKMSEMKQSFLNEVNEKDSAILNLKNKVVQTETERTTLQKGFDAVLSRLKNLATFKKVKTNADGSEVFAKANKNGAKMTMTVMPDGDKGKLKQLEVELLDGSVRRTSYNLETGKRSRTLSSLVFPDKPAEVVEHAYNDYGAHTGTKNFGIKKVKPAKPVPIGNPQIISNDPYFVKVKREMSDGSCLISTVDKESNEVISWMKKEGSWITEWYEKTSDGVIYTGKRSVNFNLPETRNISYPSGVKCIYPYSVTQDELTGVKTITNRITFPKNFTEVKRMDSLTVEGSNVPTKTIVKMKNGDVYTLTKYEKQKTNSELTPRNGLELLVPSKVVKTSKSGDITEMPKEDIRAWLETIHPDFNFKLRGTLSLNSSI